MKPTREIMVLYSMEIIADKALEFHASYSALVGAIQQHSFSEKEAIKIADEAVAGVKKDFDKAEEVLKKHGGDCSKAIAELLGGAK
jgi:hypothetical protein